MSEYIGQGSASDRLDAARKALAHYAATSTHDPKEWAIRAVPVAEALRALIAPPGVGETDEEIATRVMRTIPFRTTLIGEHVCLAEGMLSDLALACVRAGIQNAHETWEPEVALRPTQEQMLRWLGLEHTDEPGRMQILVHEQHIDREEI